MPYSTLEDKELFDKLRKAELAEMIKNNEAWHIFEEMRKRVVENAIAEFAIRTDPTNLAKIIELQVIIKKYKYMFLEEIERRSQEGKIVFEEIKDREVLSDIT